MHDDARLDEVLNEWEQAVESGQEVTLEELCRGCPDLLEAARGVIEKLRQADCRFSAAGATMTAPIRIDQFATDPRGCQSDEAASNTNGSEETLQTTAALMRLKFHAKGGLGAVYRGMQSGLNREVAVKFIHQGLIGDADSEQRFRLEAEVTSRLDHPGVVPLYGEGMAEDGRLFYYMRFVDGRTLDQAVVAFHSPAGSQSVDEKLVEFKRILNSLVAVCRTVAYAHNRGIVHRDLKPANIILGRFGETLVIDWGLATYVGNRAAPFKGTGEQSLVLGSGSQSGTSTGSGAGTPAYMSPQQMMGNLPSPADDVYSLGATLYKVLTGEPAFHGSSTRDDVANGVFPAPSAKNPAVSRALEAVCLKAMSNTPQGRYRTALELAQDIENFIADARVSAYCEPLERRVARWARHHRQSVQIAAVALLTMLVLCVFGMLALSSSRDRVISLQNQSEAAREQNLRNSAISAADMVEHEIDSRWLLILAETHLSPLRDYLNEANQVCAAISQPEERRIALMKLPLQRWIQDRFQANGMHDQRDSFAVFGLDGTQVARWPRAKSIGDQFAYRDYFHGGGSDRAPGTVLAPMQELIDPSRPDRQLAHVCAAFHSVNSRELMVAFSAPIWSAPPGSPDRTIIGVFSLPIHLKDIGLPKHALLFDLDPQPSSDQKGMILAHGDSEHFRTLVEKERQLSVGKQTVDAAEQLRHPKGSANALIRHFEDPVSHEVSMAVIAPVIVDRWVPQPRLSIGGIGDVGWAVLVRETQQPDSHMK